MKLSDEVINSLSLNLREKIKTLKRENIEEIRLRVNKPLIINGDSQDYFYNDINGDLDLVMRNPYIVTKEDIEDTFQSFFGTKVKLDAKQKSGKIIIKYSSNEELERILELIRNDGNE